MGVTVVCNYCSRSFDNNKKCSICRLAIYCSQECQLLDWRDHKIICSDHISSLPKDTTFYTVPNHWRCKSQQLRALAISRLDLYGPNIPFCELCGMIANLFRVRSIGRLLCSDCTHVHLNI
jgi:MYND finger